MDDLLQEDGTFLFQEDSSKILLEQQTVSEFFILPGMASVIIN